MRRQHGFGTIAAIVVLVILAALSAGIVSVGTTQQTSSAQDVMSARAWQAARAGNEWGLYQALKGIWTTACDAATQTHQIDLTADTGFHVTVTCNSWLYNEGVDPSGAAITVRLYQIKAVACPAATCPATGAAVASPGYVERTRVVMATN
ncbi:MAG: hypothetical protein PHY45_07625 [Rhodocyclaceae bacterium]|nr:hypothetical protein [Rhodocyclaceae bacterium]